MNSGAKLPKKYELVTAGGFEDAQKAQSTLCGEVFALSADQEEADTHLILHSLEAVEKGFNRIEVICRDTDVILMPIHFLGYKNVWMVSGTAKQTK